LFVITLYNKRTLSKTDMVFQETDEATKKSFKKEELSFKC